MSDAVDVVKHWYALAEAQDEARMREHLDPDVVWFGTRGGLDQDQVLRGPDAVLAYLREIQEPWDRYNVEVERFMATGGTVLAFMRETGRAHHSSAEMENHTAMIFTVRGGRISEMKGYLDPDEALAAADLTG